LPHNDDVKVVPPSLVSSLATVLVQECTDHVFKTTKIGDSEDCKVYESLHPYVKSVFIIHVGGTRCVTSSIENIMKIRARITLTVEFIRGYIFKFLFYV